MLRDAGAQAVIGRHSERRAITAKAMRGTRQSAGGAPCRPHGDSLCRGDARKSAMPVQTRHIVSRKL